MNNNYNSLNNKPPSIWDPVAFNKQFDVYIEENKKNRLLQQKAKLQDINDIVNKEPELYELPLNIYLKKLLDTWTKLFTNFYTLDLSIYSANDLLNIGITFICIAIIFLLVSNIFS